MAGEHLPHVLSARLSLCLSSESSSCDRFRAASRSAASASVTACAFAAADFIAAAASPKGSPESCAAFFSFAFASSAFFFAFFASSP